MTPCFIKNFIVSYFDFGHPGVVPALAWAAAGQGGGSSLQQVLSYPGLCLLTPHSSLCLFNHFILNLSNLNQPNPTLQIGSNWAITAAHCVMEWETREDTEEEEEEDVEEVVPASDLTFWLGVGDRTRLTPRAR